MSKWQSNGPGRSPNESKLEGELVVFRAGGKIRAIGKLKEIRANTRGNWTKAVCWKQVRPSDGNLVRRDVPIWTMRKLLPFTIEAFDPTNPRVDEAAWIDYRGVRFPAEAAEVQS